MSIVSSSHKHTLRMVQIALFAALVAVMQVLSTVIPMPYVKITLTLIPVVLGGVYFGKKAAAILGGVFGLVVTLFTISGFDGGAYMMFTAKPIMTVFICFAKGILSGFISACVFEALQKCQKVGKALSITFAAGIAPIVNTAFFCTFLFLFYPQILSEWAAGTNVLVYMITVLVGINFVVEFILNIILCPVIGTKINLK